MLLWYGGGGAAGVALETSTGTGAGRRGHPVAGGVVVRARACACTCTWRHWRGGAVVVVVVGHVARGRRGVLRAVHVGRNVDSAWSGGEVGVVVRRGGYRPGRCLLTVECAN